MMTRGVTLLLVSSKVSCNHVWLSSLLDVPSSVDECDLLLLVMLCRGGFCIIGTRSNMALPQGLITCLFFK